MGEPAPAPGHSDSGLNPGPALAYNLKGKGSPSTPFLALGLAFVVLDVHGGLGVQQQGDQLRVAVQGRMMQGGEAVGKAALREGSHLLERPSRPGLALRRLTHQGPGS